VPVRVAWDRWPGMSPGLASQQVRSDVTRRIKRLGVELIVGALAEQKRALAEQERALAEQERALEGAMAG
jgi:hypothetical protein